MWHIWASIQSSGNYITKSNEFSCKKTVILRLNAFQRINFILSSDFLWKQFNINCLIWVKVYTWCIFSYKSGGLDLTVSEVKIENLKEKPSCSYAFQSTKQWFLESDLANLVKINKLKITHLKHNFLLKQ